MPPMYVLVVEDDDDIRNCISEILASEGYDVAQARDGFEALATLAARAPETPCVMLVDLMMPGMNGWDLVRTLRRGDRYFAIPIVITTSTEDPETSQLGPINRVIKKPYDLGTLLSEVARHCGGGS